MQQFGGLLKTFQSFFNLNFLTSEPQRFADHVQNVFLTYNKGLNFERWVMSCASLNERKSHKSSMSYMSNAWIKCSLCVSDVCQTPGSNVILMARENM